MPSDTSETLFDIDRKLPERRFLPFLQPSSVVGDLLSKDLEQISGAVETNMVIHSVFLLNEVPQRAPVYRVPTNSNVVPDTIRENWQALANSCLSDRSYLHLLKLAKKEHGWRGLGTRSLDGRSLGQFLSFWTNARSHAIEPEFALLPNGNLQAEWYRDDHHFTELEFRSDGLVFFAFFDGSSEIEGLARLTEIQPLIEARDYRYLRWSLLRGRRSGM